MHVLYHLVPVCPGCKSSNQDAVALQYVIGLDIVMLHLALLKEHLAHYVPFSFVLIKIFFKGFFFHSFCFIEKLL